MKNLYVIDAYNLIYRMFYAIPEMHTKEGEQVNAIYGVTKFIRQLIDLGDSDEIIIASESGSNFREELYSEYKGTRDRMPDNLRSQIEGVFACFEAFGIPVLTSDWYEADDVIGTIAASHYKSECEVIIISSDKDLCQFVVDGKVRIFDAMKQKNLRRADVIEKFGVPPEQVRDYLSIVGDSSDNIPGIAGFWPKKAEDLLRRFASLSGIYEHLSELPEKMQATLIAQKENAFLSQKLATIVTDLDLSFEPQKLTKDLFSSREVIDFLKLYEFRSLLPRDYVEIKKSLEKWNIIEVNDTNMLDSVLELIKKEKKIELATEKTGNISLGIHGYTYSIDTTHVDVRDFAKNLLSLDVEIIGYDLKEDLKYLLSLEKLLQGVEGQGRLF
jgi:DNA polymerase I